MRLCKPTASEPVAYIAIPEELRVPLPSITVPSLKVTEPPGCGAPTVPVTVAVSVRLGPKTLMVGAVRTVMVAVVGVGVVTMKDVEALVSPELVAAREYVPAEVRTTLLRLKLATPFVLTAFTV